MAGPLEAALDDDDNSCYKELLVVSVFASCRLLKFNSFDRNLPGVWTTFTHSQILPVWTLLCGMPIGCFLRIWMQ